MNRTISVGWALGGGQGGLPIPITNYQLPDFSHLTRLGPRAGEFMEALEWEHGVEFLCVAFQNRVAYAMGGVTLHTGGDVNVGSSDRGLDHTDIDVLFTRNQDLRWLLFDEIGMLGYVLLGVFEKTHHRRSHSLQIPS